MRAEAQAADGAVDVDAQLAGRARDAGPVHPKRLYRAVKRFFATSANAAQRAGTPHARAFLAASPHWLRHTFASHALANGVSLESVRIFLGHASLGTTTIYSNVELAVEERNNCEYERINCEPDTVRRRGELVRDELGSH